MSGPRVPAASPRPGRRPRTGFYQSRRALTQLRLGLTYLVLGAGLVFVLLPMFWLISTALKHPGDVYAYPPVFLSIPPYWQSFAEIFAFPRIPMWLFIRNSLIVALPSVVGTVVSSALVAYSFARLRWWGRDYLFAVTLAMMMLPSQVTLIPTYILFRTLGWLDTWFPLIVPSLFGAPFYIFLLRQFFLTIPPELDDAARTDGCGPFGIFGRIVLPLSKPALATVAIFSFQHHWNDFFTPLIYLNSVDRFVLALGIRLFNTPEGAAQQQWSWNYLMAASFLAILPVLVTFFFAQRLFVQGIVVSGAKG
jgi:ABC-type glycerol-3-phosphate transport system permease component